MTERRDPVEAESAVGSAHRAPWGAVGGTVRAGAFAVLALAVGLGGAALPVEEVTTAPVRSISAAQTLVCAPGRVAGTLAAGSTSSSLDIGDLGSSTSEHSVPWTTSTGTGAVVVRSRSGQGQPAASLASTSGAQSSWSSCQTPSTGGLVSVSDPSHADIVVSNPGSSAATVDVTLLGTKGEVQAEGSRGIVVGAGASRVLPLSVWDSGTTPVTAVISSSDGRIVAQARTWSQFGQDVAPMVAARRTAYLATVPASASSSVLLLSNPGNARVDVSVKAISTRGTFTPEGADGIVVEPRSTIAVDLSSALAGESLALTVSAKSEIGAQLVSSRKGDYATVVATDAATVLQQALPAAGTLEVSNPGSTTAQVSGTLTTATGTRQVTATIPAGTTWTSALTTGGFLRLTSDQPVAAGVVAATGTSTVPLSPVIGATRARAVQVDPQLG